MKTILSKLSDKKAQEELPRFAMFGLGASVVSLLVFWWLGIMGVGFGIRGLLLSAHKGNKGRKDLLKFKAMSIGAIVLGLVSIVAYSATN